jgi:hypothetical protein
MVDVLLRAAPWKARTIGEREQADDLYKANTSLRVRLILFDLQHMIDDQKGTYTPRSFS